MKYHYFHSFFTDSVKWSEASKGAKLLESKCVKAVFGGYAALAVFGRWVAVALPARSPPRTVSGGEFDWGGTSVKG